MSNDARDLLAWKQRISLEDKTLVNFIGEYKLSKNGSFGRVLVTASISFVQARKLEHKLGSPQRKFEPFKRNILPHIDSDDAVSVAGSDIDSDLAELYARQQRVNSQQMRPFAEFSAAGSSTAGSSTSASRPIGPNIGGANVSASVDLSIARSRNGGGGNSSSNPLSRSMPLPPGRFNEELDPSMLRPTTSYSTKSRLKTPKTPPGASLYRIDPKNTLKIPVLQEKLVHKLSSTGGSLSGAGSVSSISSAQPRPHAAPQGKNIMNSLTSIYDDPSLLNRPHSPLVKAIQDGPRPLSPPTKNRRAAGPIPPAHPRPISPKGANQAQSFRQQQLAEAASPWVIPPEHSNEQHQTTSGLTAGELAQALTLDQEALIKIKALELSLEEERSGRVQVQKELEELKRMMEALLKSSSTSAK